MKNGPLIHQSAFDLTEKLNEDLFYRSILGGANSSGEQPVGTIGGMDEIGEVVIGSQNFDRDDPNQ